MIFSIFKESSNTFEGQEPGEKVSLLIRRHPFYIVMKFFFMVIAVGVPALLIVTFSPYLFSNGLMSAALWILGLWTLVLWVIFFYALTMYTLDVWIVTDRRIIDSTQHGFFGRKIAELHMERVQDVSVHIQGLVQSALHFGDLDVQTAGTEDHFKFVQIPRPELVKNEIMKIASSKHPAGNL